MSRIRRLVSDDAARHGGEQAAAAAVEAAVSGPSALDLLSEQLGIGGVAVNAAPTAAAAILSGDMEPDEVPPALPPEGDHESSSPTVPVEAASYDGPPDSPESADHGQHPVSMLERMDDDRPELLNIIGSMAPILRATQVFPGTGGSPQLASAAISMMSKDAVRVAHMLARETDFLECDLEWRRRNSGRLVCDLIGTQWISLMMATDGGAFPDAWASEGAGRVSAALCTAIDVARMPDAEILASTGIDLHAAVFALAPVLVEMQRYVEHVRRQVPDVDPDLDGAALALAVTLAEEVRAGVARLAEVWPHGASKSALLAELMAACGPLALAAWDETRGVMFGLLKDCGDDLDAIQGVLTTKMQDGIPITVTCERVRASVRRLVNMSYYAGQAARSVTEAST